MKSGKFIITANLLFVGICIALASACHNKAGKPAGITEMRVCDNPKNNVCEEDMSSFPGEPENIYITATMARPEENKEMIVLATYRLGDLTSSVDSQVLALKGNETLMRYALGKPASGWMAGEYTVSFISLKDSNVRASKTFTITPQMRFSGIWIGTMKEIDRSSQMPDAVTALPGTITRIYLEAQLNHLAKGRTATIEWFNVKNPDKPLFTRTVAMDNVNMVNDALDFPKGGYPLGTYEVRVSLDDSAVPAATRRFILQ